MVPTFKRNEAELCFIYNHMPDYIYTQHRHRLQSWNQHFLKPEILQEYASVIHKRDTPSENCFEFIDGTVTEMGKTKPIYQRTVYNDHKKVRSIRFLALRKTTP